MKTTQKLILTITLLSITSIFAQKNTIGKDLKMYEQVWDNIVNKGQLDLINDKNFAPNIVQINPSGNITGIAAFKAYYQNYLTGFSDIKFTVMKVFGQDDNIVKHWRFEGKHTGAFFGIPATQKQVNIEGVTLVIMKNGRIAQEQDFMDNTILMQQLGLASDLYNLTIVDGLYRSFVAGDNPSVKFTEEQKLEYNESEDNKWDEGILDIGPNPLLDEEFELLAADYDYFRIADIELHEMSNNQVLATLRLNPKYQKYGKKYPYSVAHLWTLRDGKVIAFQQYAYLKQLSDTDKK